MENYEIKFMFEPVNPVQNPPSSSSLFQLHFLLTTLLHPTPPHTPHPLARTPFHSLPTHLYTSRASLIIQAVVAIHYLNIMSAMTISLVYFILGACAVSVTAAGDTTTGGGPASCSAGLEPGYDYFNNAPGHTNEPAESVAECCAKCEAIGPSKCAYFTYQTQQKICYLKLSNVGKRSDPNCISGQNPTYTPPKPCEGEFTACRDSGVCTMSSFWCGSNSACKTGQYLCPSDSKTCVDTAADYVKCPGIKGTHFDWTLDTEARLDYLVAHANLTTQISQLQNTAPEMLDLGIPEYQWLNDDQHGVARTPAHATVFPNGVGLGATFAHNTLRSVGFVVGNEARGLHNGFLRTDPTGREMKCNGCSLTMYAPNLNLVR